MIILFITSCEEWTPEADAWYEVDGKKYDLHLMTILTSPFGVSPHNNNFEINFDGASGNNINASIFVPNTTVETGKYKLTFLLSDAPSMNFVNIRRRYINDMNSDINSTGTMTVQASGRNYIVDFSGTIQGHQVKIHYDGIVAYQ
jgi:hypothetical protein